MTAGFNLQRFIDAQDRIYPSVLDELRSGAKRGHWMWFIFPQIQGLGSSAISQNYAIGSREEAQAYSEHPILGARLRECTQLVMAVEGSSAERVFPYPDNLKFRSCLTLFEQSATDPSTFQAALHKYFGGERDRLTLEILKGKANQ
jgi:uncharacterized protein (DUF1810 family)